MKRSGGRSIETAAAFAALFTERTFLVALAFSVALHGSVFLLWKPLLREAEPEAPKLMVARLVRQDGRAVPATEEGTDAGGSRSLDGHEGLRAPVSDETGGAGKADGGEETRTGEGPVPAIGARGTTGSLPGGAREGLRLSTSPGTARGRGEPLLLPSAAAVAKVVASRAEGGGSSSKVPGEALAEIRRRIEKQKRYPLLARRNGWEGDVLVEIRPGGDGSPAAVEVVDPSAYPILDRATLAAVRRAGPFPSLPGRVRVPVSYRLDGIRGAAAEANPSAFTALPLGQRGSLEGGKQ